ncbi:plexin domain-containing protein 2-like [Stegodyphus dumicola]|uniref:plexin domain-containing protein 2-like n=1 Tax=Stegodyphus dumicola TaxID=202533 RepID=UPI0015A7D9CC|nr:plexin domain-containing protein 2-like [Stegodyphus dumicola]
MSPCQDIGGARGGTVELSFDFPFYGSLLRNVTIATGGFLYTGDYLHNWIAATQYIAPLMANFDTSLSTESEIKYADRSTSFVVQWNKVFIQGRMNDGAFTFQVVLKQNGDIVFGYKDVPYPISNISESHHPVKIGISDAYILETSLFFVRRKTIYEYHRIDLLKRNITNNTALYFSALPTCSSFKDCMSCMAADAKLECNWCEAVKRCSDGIDRLRQNWISNGCMHVRTYSCPASSVSTSTDQSLSSTSPGKRVEITTKYLTTKDATSKSASTYSFDSGSGAYNYAEYKSQQAAHFVQEEEETFQRSISPGAIATIVIFLTALIAAGIWVAYAYKFPQTPSGQFLIKYRPSQWAFKKEDTGVITNSRHL